VLRFNRLHFYLGCNSEAAVCKEIATYPRNPVKALWVWLRESLCH